MDFDVDRVSWGRREDVWADFSLVVENNVNSFSGKGFCNGSVIDLGVMFFEEEVFRVDVLCWR